MDKTFAGLLRNSRIASYDRTLPQVYTTPIKAKKTGNWGFKRSLPTVIRTRYVTVDNLDTAEHQTPWQSGEGKVLFVKRWKENFPNSKAPAPRREQVQHNVAAMSPRAFKQFLKQASQQAPAFKQALENKQVVPDQVYEFLNCHFNKDWNASDEGVVGPTYSNHQAVEWNYPVHGRILNKDQENGFAVGIGGVVAQLLRRDSTGLKNSGDRRVREFYVVSAQTNGQGKPEVTVRLQEQTPSMAGILTSYMSPNARSSQRNNDEPALEDMFAGRKSARYNNLRTEPDNLQQNPGHDDLMSRISDLLDTSAKK